MSDAAELEREAEAARARLSDTAEQLRARMSPGQMMDEVLSQFRGGDGSQMLANLKTQARDNPMALALIGGGLAWLMMGSGPETPVRSLAGKLPPPPTPSASPLSPRTAHGGAAALAGDSSGGGEHDSPISGAGIAETASGALASARDAIGDRLHTAGSQAGGLAQDLQAAGSEALGDIRQSAAGLGYQARRGFLDVLEREPLVIGAIGVAVGAAIGALLPATELERQHLAPAGEALKEKADALVDRGVSVAKEAATEIYATTREEADRQGLRPGDTPIAQKIDAVVRAAGETAGSIVERHAPDSPSGNDASESPSGNAAPEPDPMSRT